MKLDKENVDEIFNLIPIQEGMLFSDLKNQEEQLYYEHFIFELKGNLEDSILESSWLHCISKFDVLRTVFRWEGLKKPIQIILKEKEVPIKFLNSLTDNNEITEEVAKDMNYEIIKKRIDLTENPFMVFFIRKNEHCYDMILKFHHIIMDGWSLGIILTEFMNTYTSLSNEGLTTKVIKDRSFRNYFQWLNQQDKNIKTTYWKKYLNQYRSITYLPYDNITSKQTVIKEKQIKLEQAVYKEIKNFAQRNQITISAFFYGLWACILNAISREEDVLFGRVVSGRPAELPFINESVGIYVNTIPLRVKFNSKDTIKDLLTTIKNMCIEQTTYEGTASFEINSVTENKKGLLYDHVVVIENYPLDRLIIEQKDITLSVKDAIEKTNYPFVLRIEPFDSINFVMSYESDKFSDSTIDLVMKEYISLIHKVLKNSECAIKDYEILSNSGVMEKYPYLNKEVNYRNISREEIDNITLMEYLDQCYERYSDRIAIEIDQIQVTYSQLKEKSNNIANNIRKLTKNPNRNGVALLFEHGLDMIYGMTGAIKSGRMFIALDKMFPEQRLLYMIQQSGVDVIVCNKENWAYSKKLKEKCNREMDILVIDDLEKLDETENTSVTPDDVTLLIYTSGSTGLPKGVIQTSKNLLFHIAGYINSLKVNKEDRVALFTTYSHSVAVIDIFSTLLTGGTILPYDIKTNANREKVLYWLEDKKITLYHSVPTLYRYLFQKQVVGNRLKNIRLVILGGEAVDRQDFLLYQKNFSTDCVLVNFFGASEVMTGSFCYFDHSSEVTQSLLAIGKFIEGVDVNLIDNNGEEVGLIGIGEIVYSSKYIASSYWNEENSVNYQVNTGNNILYRSGDLGKRCPDGNILYCGRKDFQIKINGHRIETTEIEELLNQHENIDRSLVICKHVDNRNQLVAYYTVKHKNTIHEEELSSYLINYLPTYMIPYYYKQIEEFPLTPNGKIDRNGLPEITLHNEMEYDIDHNLKTKLVDIWKDILGVETVKMEDNFFALGGHSLKLFELINAINKEFGISIAMDKVFGLDTLGTLAQYLQNNIPIEVKQIGLPQLTHIEENEYYPLSAAQKRIYYHSKSSADQRIYNETTALEMTGLIDLTRLQTAINQLVRKYEIFRTGFHMMDGVIYQKVEEKVEIQLELIQADEIFIDQTIHNFIRPFDLQRPSLMRVGLIQLKKDRYILLVDMHHIITDGTTMSIIAEELAALYSGIEKSSPVYQYRDYVHWQEQVFKSDFAIKQEEFWLKQFEGEVPVVDFQCSTKKMEEEKSNLLYFTMNQTAREELYAISQQNGVTIFMLLLSVYFSTLNRYSLQEKLIVGVPVANRPIKELNKMPGVFINMLPVIETVGLHTTFKDLLQSVRNTLIYDYENQQYPFDLLVEKLLDANRIESSNLFQCIFDFQNMDFNMQDMEGIQVKRYEITESSPEYGIVFKGYEEDQQIKFVINYNPLLYSNDFISQFANTFLNLTEKLCKNIDELIANVSIISEVERIKIDNFNSTDWDYMAKPDILQRFKEQVLIAPKNLAVRDDHINITYEEFDQLTDKVAAMLVNKGVKRDTIVCIYMRNCIEVIIYIWGIHKAGGAVMPIASHTPEDRLFSILQNTNTNLVVTNMDINERIFESSEVIRVEKVCDIKNKEYGKVPVVHRDDKSLLYVINTSGSTGQPKTVMLEEAGVRNNMYFSLKEFNITQEDVVGLVSSIAFDISQLIFFAPFMAGAAFYINDSEDDSKKVKDVIENCTITILTPTNLTLLFNNLPSQSSMKTILIAGEVLTVDLCKKVRIALGEDINIYNLYGPTEATIFSTYHKYSPEVEIGETVSIGCGIDNVKIHIINPMGKIQPIGVYGELVISGEGLAREYMNQPELTKKLFVDDEGEINARIYKTGDIARWMSDGNLQFLGRKDAQVKIRGFRIELDEVKGVIDQCEGVKNSVVVDCTDENNEKFLCAYMVLTKEVTVMELQNSMLTKLPKYMIPSAFVKIESMPVTLTGKINRRMLPKPHTNIEIGNLYVPAENLMEEYCIDLWKALFGLDNIGVNDDFFLLGGNSLKAMSFIEMLERQHKLKLDLIDIYQNTTIRNLVKHIKKSERNKIVLLEKVQERNEYPLSAAQRRMYLSNLLKGVKNSDNNIASAYIVHGHIEEDKIYQAFHHLVKRHEILRTSFEMRSEEPVQIVHKDVLLEYERKEVEFDCVNEEIDKFIRPFDLSLAPLFRVLQLKISEEKYIFCIDAHHIVYDGYSQKILMDELWQLYNGTILPDLQYQYKDYAIWHQKYMNSESVQNQKNYWLKVFEGIQQRKELFIDYDRPTMVSFEGDSVSVLFGCELTEKIKNIAYQEKISVFSVLITIYNILVSIYSETDDVVVGTPVFGRQFQELEEMIGLFINTVPVRSKINSNQSFKEILHEVHHNLLGAFENQDYQFDTLVNELGLKTTSNRNPLFDTMITFQNTGGTLKGNDNLILENYDIKNGVSSLDIVFHISDGECFKGKMTYAVELFRKETIEEFVKSYVLMAKSVTNNMDIKIKDIQIVEETIGVIEEDFTNDLDIEFEY